METRVQRWGNSLALRIPKLLAHEANLQENSAVEISVRGGKLVIVAVSEPELSLEALVEQITDDNRHGETEWGNCVGEEVW